MNEGYFFCRIKFDFKGVIYGIRKGAMVLTRSMSRMKKAAWPEIYRAGGFSMISDAGSVGPIATIDQKAHLEWVSEVMDRYKMSPYLRKHFYAVCHHRWTHCRFLVLPEGRLCMFGGEGLYMPREYEDDVDRSTRMMNFVAERKRRWDIEGDGWIRA